MALKYANNHAIWFRCFGDVAHPLYVAFADHACFYSISYNHNKVKAL